MTMTKCLAKELVKSRGIRVNAGECLLLGPKTVTRLPSGEGFSWMVSSVIEHVKESRRSHHVAH